ncbi:DUF6498-containing protein [Halovivax gelatinilyticus]|uniref:DUF6498-containing protein n=1 Tax=Halovivax gelatinilyticus TaxID=2961597 RepID=UPI0020CA33C3|nr:DUF6498-containing protein [Halovivax gelatinilyticus]
MIGSVTPVRRELVFLSGTNLVALVGVVALGWNAATLVTLYWFELAVVCFWALVRGLFAGRPSSFDCESLIVGALAERPIGIPIPLTGLRIQLTSIPVFVAAVPALAIGWFGAGVVTVGLIGTATETETVVTTVTVAVVAIFFVEGGRTVATYLVGGGYRDHSAQTAVQGALWRCLSLFFVGLLAALIAVAVDPSVGSDEPVTETDATIAAGVLSVALVLLKVGIDLSSVYRDRLVAFDESLDVSIGWADEPPGPEPIDGTVGTNARTVSPPVAGRLLAGLSHARRFPSAWLIGAVPAVPGAIYLLAGVWDRGAGLVAIGLTATLALAHVDYWLRFGGVEYRIGDEAIVAFDRWCKTPLWRVDPWDESDLRLERDRIDEWLDTTTVVIDRPDGSLYLPRLGAPTPVVEVFDRPPTVAEPA